MVSQEWGTYIWLVPDKVLYMQYPPKSTLTGEKFAAMDAAINAMLSKSTEPDVFTLVNVANIRMIQTHPNSLVKNATFLQHPNFKAQVIYNFMPALMSTGTLLVQITRSLLGAEIYLEKNEQDALQRLRTIGIEVDDIIPTIN